MYLDVGELLHIWVLLPYSAGTQRGSRIHWCDRVMAFTLAVC